MSLDGISLSLLGLTPFQTVSREETIILVLENT